MSTKRPRQWKGLVNFTHTLLYGASQTSQPKIRNYGSTTPSSRTPDEALQPEEYRWFRRDELVRRCIVINAAYASMSAGFQTELEIAAKCDLTPEDEAALLEDLYYVKDYVDAVNTVVNLDEVLFVAQVKRSLYGKAGFEIVNDKNKAPVSLLSLQSTRLKPEINTDWTLKDFTYSGNTENYAPDELLYFVNLALENDLEGISDIEPVNAVCSARHNLLKNDFPEITRNLWAPFALLKADTSGLSEADEDIFLQAATDAVKAGKSLVFNRSVEGQVVDLNVNLAGLVAVLDKLEETIIRAFGTPRFLINKTPENRATAYVEFEAYIQGPIAQIQRYFARELERQWYPRLVKLALTKKGYMGEVPVRIKHVWNPIRASDINDMAAAVSTLYGNGLGILADHKDIAFDMMGWPKEKLTQKQQPQPQQQNVTSPPQESSNPNENAPFPGQETITQEDTTPTRPKRLPRK